MTLSRARIFSRIISLVDDSTMKLAWKIRSFLKKIRQSSKYYRYHRLVNDESDHGVVKTIDEAPTIYVSVYVGKEGKRPEIFDQLLELWSFKWDFDEGNCFIFLKEFEKWSRMRQERLTDHATPRRTGEGSLSFCY
ncbi:uncharacterized protein LOC111307713 [Durio zibethinus]|uniref:Uncharacterized protein LOC111307713 n=1 Tax=Durio zibethinus TaxID=66656 RepID=A0A6P6A9P6_DURZI|nr:uncharacterized protein LOC111307713 [Durio zibethinus]